MGGAGWAGIRDTGRRRQLHREGQRPRHPLRLAPAHQEERPRDRHDGPPRRRQVRRGQERVQGLGRASRRRCFGEREGHRSGYLLKSGNFLFVSLSFFFLLCLWALIIFSWKGVRAKIREGSGKATAVLYYSTLPRLWFEPPCPLSSGGGRDPACSALAWRRCEGLWF